MSSRWLENMAIKKSRDLKMIISRKSSIYFYWITISFFIASPFAFLSCRNANVNPPISHSSGIIPTPIPDYLFHDDFSDSSSGWDQINVQEGIADYENGQYLIGVHASNTDFWATPGINLADVMIEVDALLGNGTTDNNFGVICRYQGIHNFYYFFISSDGYYGIGKTVHRMQTLLNGDKMYSHRAINIGYENNHIKAICDDTNLILFVNGIKIAHVNDDSLKQGDVGLIAGTFSEGNSYIFFDNFIVKEP